MSLIFSYLTAAGHLVYVYVALIITLLQHNFDPATNNYQYLWSLVNNYYNREISCSCIGSLVVCSPYWGQDYKSLKVKYSIGTPGKGDATKNKLFENTGKLQWHLIVVIETDKRSTVDQLTTSWKH